jgi:hypothetical protein
MWLAWIAVKRSGARSRACFKGLTRRSPKRDPPHEMRSVPTGVFARRAACGSAPRRALLLHIALLLGCSGPPVSMGTEAGVVRAPSCEAPELVSLIEGETIRRTVDLRTAPYGVVTGCPGSGMPGQVVYEIVVPGTGEHVVEARTANPGTDRATDTVLALRRSDCASSTSDQCFDELSGDYRTNAAFTAAGGDHVFLVLTSYSEAAEGPVEIVFSAASNGPPTITSASVVVAGDELLVDVDGGDPDGNGAGVRVTLHGPAGELIDLNGDGTRSDADGLAGNFARPVTGATTFTERTRLSLDSGQLSRALTATAAYVRTVDRAGVASISDVVALVRSGTVVGRGETCSETFVCPEELLCAPGTFTCEPTPMRAATCAAAMPLGIPTPTMTTTTVSAMGNLTPGTGLFGGNCDESDGPVITDGLENIYVVHVPVGAYDLLLTTDLSGTATDADTVLYVRTDCTDPETGPEEWCNDDIVRSENLRSAVEARDVVEGDYYVFVEPWGTVMLDTTVRYELGASLRPVLPTGRACDPAEVMNRCADMPCDAATRMCP